MKYHYDTTHGGHATAANGYRCRCTSATKTPYRPRRIGCDAGAHLRQGRSPTPGPVTHARTGWPPTQLAQRRQQRHRGLRGRVRAAYAADWQHRREPERGYGQGVTSSPGGSYRSGRARSAARRRPAGTDTSGSSHSAHGGFLILEPAETASALRMRPMHPPVLGQ